MCSLWDCGLIHSKSTFYCPLVFGSVFRIFETMYQLTLHRDNVRRSAHLAYNFSIYRINCLTFSLNYFVTKTHKRSTLWAQHKSIMASSSLQLPIMIKIHFVMMRKGQQQRQQKKYSWRNTFLPLPLKHYQSVHCTATPLIFKSKMTIKETMLNIILRACV